MAKPAKKTTSDSVLGWLGRQIGHVKRAVKAANQGSDAVGAGVSSRVASRSGGASQSATSRGAAMAWQRRRGAPWPGKAA